MDASTNTTRITELVLVYNADWSIPGAVQYLRELLSGSDSCALCDITHNTVLESADWKRCRAQLAVPVRALYRNQLDTALSAVVGNEFPCVVARSHDALCILLGRDALGQCEGSAQKMFDALSAAADARGLQLA